MQKFEDKLIDLLKSLPKFVDEKTGNILRNEVVNSALKIDKELISLLIKDKEIREKFFTEISGYWVFEINKFVDYVQDKEFLDDTYTKFKNKIGLTIDNKFIGERGEVALSFPFKDCILEGGMTKEDEKRNEIFFNEVLAEDQINRLLDPKVLTNFKRYSAKVEESVTEFKRDKEGVIKENLIIKGNNLLSLYSLREQFQGRVKLIYIDPPFNTGKDSFNYNDRFNHSTWLTFVKNRLEISKNLLSDDGNIFIHIDINENHYLKVLCDEIFGRSNFVEEIVWAYGSPSGGRAGGAKPVNIHDYLLHYAKNYSERKQNKLYTPYSKQYITAWFKYTDKDGRRYQRRMRGRDEKGKVIWEKQYLDESKGLPLTSVWTDIRQVYADPRAYKENQKRHTELIRDFITQKPEKLIQRIIEMVTDKGDIVLDYTLGSGTTCAVAHKIGRQYIGLEQLNYGVNDAITRLKRVIGKEKSDGKISTIIDEYDETGISKAVNWKGGGDFIYCDLMKFNEEAIEIINNAQDMHGLLKIWKEMCERYFLNYNIEVKKFNDNIEEFKRLQICDQKRVLIEMLNKNQLYVNLSEINDLDFRVSNEDKELNKKFYSD